MIGREVEELISMISKPRRQKNGAAAAV